MLNAELKSILTPSTTLVLAVRAKTEDKTLTPTNASYINAVDPMAPKKSLADVDSRFLSERKSKTNPNPRKAHAFKEYTSLLFVGGQYDYRAENAKLGGQSLLEAADAAAARKAEGKVYESKKEWVVGYGPVKTGAHLPCTDGTDSPIEVTSQAGVLLADKENPESLTLVGYSVDGLKKTAKEAGISIPETTYEVITMDGEVSSYNPWDDQYKEFHSYAEKTREPVTPINILAENIISVEVVGTRNPDGTIDWAK